MTRRSCLIVLMAAFVVAGCGGDDDDGGSASQVADLDDALADDAASADELLSGIADAADDALADTEDAPGSVRFVNLLHSGGIGTAVDVWWGLPEDGQLATSLAYGEASEYLTPRMSTAFGEVSWSMSPAGGQEQLVGFTYTPAEDIQRTLVVFPDPSGSISTMPIDEILAFDPDQGAWGFQPPDAGQVRVKWVPIQPVIEAPSGNLRNVGTGAGDCLTNGSGINAVDDLSTRSTTFQVPGGAAVNLYEDFPTCSGPTSATATAPPAGRALLLAYNDAAQTPQLLMLAVEG